jgi:asparagine synthetase B (glutamine-hydrolysing)
LSGGVDSSSILFSALRLKKEVSCYSFQVENRPTLDTAKAEQICKKYNLKFTLVEVPTKNIKEDFKKLAKKYKCKKKTEFECTFPLLYTLPKIKEKYILSGVNADSYYGLDKTSMMHHISNKKDFDASRTKKYGKLGRGAFYQLKQICEEYNKILCAPYRCREAYNYFMQFDWSDIHKPRQKSLIRKRYPELYGLKIKPHANYQLVAGIDKDFEKLLDNPEINYKKRTRVMDMCRDWAQK